ncbi:MAG: ABC transporter ATP-binding protein, partial [Anaerolineae bacterium]|nr:ABC transporter ATP-binding protein [Anaerolineae bacterium]
QGKAEGAQGSGPRSADGTGSRPGAGAGQKGGAEESSPRPGGSQGSRPGPGAGQKGGAGASGARGGGQGGRPGPAGPAGPILRRLLRYMRPHAVILAGVVLAAVATTAVELAPPWIIRWSVDHLILGGQPGRVWWAAGGLLLLSLFQGAVDFARLYLTAYTGQRIVFEIRSAIFEHLSRLSFSFYDRARTGDLMSRVTADVDVLNNFFGRAATIVLTNLLTLVGILGILIAWDWRLGLLYVCMLPLIGLGMWAYARRVRPAMGLVRRKMAALSEALQESLAGVLVVKLFGREAFERKRVDRQGEMVLDAHLQTARISSLWMPYANVVMGVATGLVLWIGGRNVIAEVISLGTLIGFVSYIQMLLRPIRQTGMMLNVVLQALAAAERVFEVLDTQPDVRDLPGAYPLPPIEGRVRFEGVTFAYDDGPDGADALRDVDLEAAPGEMVALVGPSGAGKSTLVHLLPRFYEPQEGRITIDGHDIQQVTVQSLRDAIGIALQTVYLFDASIGENIAYGNPHAAQNEIEWAARVVQMDGFIRQLPLGYGTPVGERGVRLSGGQRQRIALARVLLTDPRILIMDEPTSSVDADTERRMQEALSDVHAGRTTFVIAHRLWTVQHADQILVLRDGRVVERARGDGARSAHEALLAAGGFYSQLVDLQFQGEALGAAPQPAQGSARTPPQGREGGGAR